MKQDDARTAAALDWIGPRGDEIVAPESLDFHPYLGPTLAEFDPDLFGTPMAQAFRAELGDATGGLRTHFHPVDQFQYFIAGTCTFGRHVTTPGVVHYSDRFTPYGPIRPMPGGVAFLTLRTRCDFGSFAMPASREELATGIGLAGLPARSRRVIACDVLEQTGDGSWATLVEHDDRLVIASASLAPDQPIDLPEISASGAYVVVTSGSVRSAAGDMERWSIAYCAAVPAGPTIVAGRIGATLALFQFPMTSPLGGVPVGFDPFAHTAAERP